MTPEADSRLSGLRRVKLRALVGDHWQLEGPLEDGTIPGGATLHTAGGERGWALIDDGDVTGFGAALAWARRREVRALHVLVEDRSRAASGIVARRAALFSQAPTVWRVEDRSLEPAIPAPPSLGADHPDVPTEVLDALSAEMAAHGVVPIIEHGTLHGEVLGLEVARAVPDGTGGWRLSVGVGRHDREAREELRPGEPTGDALEDVAALVRQWRTAPDRRHPANTLARERLLRAAVIAHPELAGAASLAPVPGPLPVDDLRTSAPAGALGLDAAGHAVVVVCSTGVDIDLVPTAADIRLIHAPDAALVLVMPAPDAYPLTRDLAAALLRPAEVRTVREGWATLAT
ncbi:hypothetical protein K6U06_19080 [Acidiferrimicrobium sp. IK]|uniref:hypothetical protein n=1 Tax=Acidiferrimicrobium sp. IK TaxID=2871700 RepID=UPI0021CB25B3|nr:hypothetical protein [Acidiferrimicrobium sp. IK]MCU4186479.1 hypothetical protein [Acidiferrimicrobium sp. IK]